MLLLFLKDHETYYLNSFLMGWRRVHSCQSAWSVSAIERESELLTLSLTDCLRDGGNVEDDNQYIIYKMLDLWKIKCGDTFTDSKIIWVLQL